MNMHTSLKNAIFPSREFDLSKVFFFLNDLVLLQYPSYYVWNILIAMIIHLTNDYCRNIQFIMFSTLLLNQYFYVRPMNVVSR